MLRFLASTAFVIGSLVSVQAPQTAPALPSADTLALSAPVALVTFDTGKIKGDPRRLSWSPDHQTLYLQSLKMNGARQELHHFYVAVNERAIKNAPGEPLWSTVYWTMKSGRSAPENPDVEIAIDVRQERVEGGPTALGGAMSGEALSGQSSISDPKLSPQQVADRSLQTQEITTYRLTLRGETVGKGVQGEFFPGKTFGWAPASIGAIAFSDEQGRLVVMDLAKRKQVVAGTASVLLPAWSTDGRRIAFLQKTGKKQFTAYVVEVH